MDAACSRDTYVLAVYVVPGDIADITDLVAPWIVLYSIACVVRSSKLATACTTACTTPECATNVPVTTFYVTVPLCIVWAR